MRRHVLLLAAAMLALPATAQAYTQQLSAQTTSNGQNHTLNFTSLPTGSGTVTLTIGLQGDFSYGNLSNPEGAVITADGAGLGTFIPANDLPSSGDCTGDIYEKDFTFDTSLINNNSAVSIGIDLYAEVGTFCSQNNVFATIVYTANTAPVLSAVSDQTTVEDTADTATFTVSDAEDSNGAVLVSAASSDTAIVSTVSAVNTGGAGTLSWTPVLNANGTATITLTATDSGALTATQTFDITVTPVNDAPVADAGGPYSGGEGSAIAMNGSGSTDVDDAIVSYDWDCDNDGSFETTSATASGATCTFDDEGIYTVSMNATDATGATSPTVTATVNVSNVAPSVLISGPSTGDEGDSLVYLAIATDPSSGDAAALTFVWTVTPSAGPPSTTSGPSSLTFVPADDDTYTVAVTVTDPAAATGADVVSVVVGNVAPALTITGPSTGDEGDALTWSLAASDAGSVDNANLTTIWEITESGGTVASGTGTSVSWTPADDGAYTLSAVTTDPQSATGTDSIGITISNVSPVVGQPSGPSTGDEGDALSWTLAGSDAGSTDNAALTYAWSISDGAGTVANGTGNAVNWTPADDGAYTLTTTVTDPQSASDTGTFAITIANVAPAVDSLTGPATGDEGSTYGFDATVSDVGADDVAGLVTTWDWGDATPTETGVSLSHTWADDGVYTVTVTVDDGDGGSDTDSLTVTIGNVDPIIDTTPGATAPESTLYSYSPTVTDPGDEVFTWTLSPNAPPLMTVDGATGAIAWTPSYADALVGNFSVTLTVDDGDGGTAFQSWTIEVTVADNDADGLADGWELANGLDPNDPNDAAGDPDADGLTNLDEFTEGTDPNSYDGPSAPTLTEPIAGDETSDVSPDLFWTNATDPQNEALSYTVEVYEDSALTTLAASMTNVAEDLSGTSTWKVDLLLTENTEYWWRARATDAWVDGPWSVEESFVVNAVNEAPGLASLTFPIDGETAASASPVLTWSEATDVDGDLLTYDVEVYDDEGVLLTSTTEVAGDGTSATWQVDVALDEDQFYSWTVLATDEHGLDGDWTEEESFFVSSENGAPSDTVFIRPENESQIVEVQPELEVSVSEDPEGGLVTYEFELDTVNTFDSADLVTASGSDSVWSLADDGITLTETTWYARVAAVDEAGISSVPDTISFFVRGENDAPDVPELISPADGAEGEATPLLVVGTPLDPEGDVVFIDFRVARDAEMTDVIAEVSGVVADLAADTDWLVNVNISGTVYWTARAVDADGAASEWAGAWSYTGPSETEAPGDDDDDDDGAGCECQSDMGATPGSALAALALLLPLAWRRRRS